MLRKCSLSVDSMVKIFSKNKKKKNAERDITHDKSKFVFIINIHFNFVDNKSICIESEFIIAST